MSKPLNTGVLFTFLTTGVVFIAKNFNDDMSDYLNKISKSRENNPPFSPAKKSKKKKVHPVVPVVSEDEVYVEYDEPSGFGSWFAKFFGGSSSKADFSDVKDDISDVDAAELEEIEDDIDRVDVRVDELEEVRESLISRFLKSMRFARSSSDVEDVELNSSDVPYVDEDVKEVLKILHSWLEKLPNKELRAFRTSDDFDRYKVLLEKYDLIKK